MTNYKVVVLILSIALSAFGSAFTLRTSDHFYQLQDRIDTSRSKSEHYADFGLRYTDIGGSGLSFNSDLLYTNALATVSQDGSTRASERQPLQLTSGYLSWASTNSAFEMKLGRQQCTNLAVEAFNLDGAAVHIAAGKATSINVGAGLIVPTPLYLYGNTNKPLLSNPANSSIITADFYNTSLSYATISGALAMEKSLHGIETSRVSLGTTIFPTDFIQIEGSGRFSTAVNDFDHLDAMLTVTPSRSLEMSAWLLSERDRIDSLNYFTIMLHDQLTESGARFAYYPEGGWTILGEYHLTSIKNEGVDHYIIFNAANTYLEGGVSLGAGSHGVSLRPIGAVTLPLFEYMQVKGTAEYNWIDETDNDGTYELMTFSAGLKGIFPMGLSIYPRVEYITNRYYTRDLRFLMTSTLLFHRFWRTDT